jgi:penicillin-binding protein 1A
MTRRKRRISRRRPRAVPGNIRARVADFFGWPWFGGFAWLRWPRRWTFGRLVKFGFLSAFWGGVLLAAMIFILSLGLPNINKAVDMDDRPTVILRDRTGKEFARMGDIQGEILPVSAISPHMIKAVLAIEDRRFYSHFGIDPLGMGRAFVANIVSGGVRQGGSTITQQLAKNLFLTPERTITRKIKEALLAIYLEQKYTKDEILAAYLNRAYFGAGAYGVDSAARVYFNTSGRELTLEQAAMLAGLLKAPSRYSPDNDPKLNLQRTRTVLIAMVDAGYLRPGAEKMNMKPLPAREYSASGNSSAQYYADWIMGQVEGYIGVPTQNLVIDTTLDSSIENFAATTVKNYLDKEGKEKDISQAAMVIMTPDGAVITMIGGRDYGQSQYNRSVLSLRQPGSSFKPFIYLAALEAGYTPDMTVIDEPFRKGKYAPHNYDGKYHGPIRLQDAVAMSINTVAVRTLSEIGVGPTKRVAQRMGITEPLSSDLSLALGTSEIRLLSLTSAYATLANRGLSVQAYGIRMIRTVKGQVLYERKDLPATPVLDSYTVANMNQMLQAVILYGTGQGAMIDRPAAGKTGTTSDYRDAWFMGYTADLVGGVWVGNDDNSPMKKVTGGSTPARIWRDVMAAAHRGISVKPLSTTSSYNGAVPTYNNGAQPTNQQGPATLFDNLLRNLLGEPKPAPRREPDIQWDDLNGGN